MVPGGTTLIAAAPGALYRKQTIIHDVKSAANLLTSWIIGCKIFLRRDGTVGRAAARTIHVRELEMPPLPSNNTDVLFVDYSVGGENHTLQCRVVNPSGAPEAMSAVDDFLTAISPLLRTITIVSARYRVATFSVTLPVTWTGAASYGSGSAVHFETAYFVDFVGRDDDGRRCRAAVFGANVPADVSNDDFRLTRAENSAVDDALSVLEAATDEWQSISGLKPSWHQYANIGTNAYWRNHIR